MITRIKGTHDMIDMRAWNQMIQMITKQLSLYHFTQIATPIIEPLDLFKRGLGTETDVVGKEMFLCHSSSQQNQDTDAICLRPEATAPIVRAFVENGIQQLPWKVFLYGPMFRYERPQKGRYRQFNQVSIEVIGSAAIETDVELIVMLERLFSDIFNVHSYALHLNFIGCFNDRHAYKQRLKEYLDTAEAGVLCSTCLARKDTNILRVFDCKNPTCQAFLKNAPKITDSLCAECATEWKTLQETLSVLSVSYSHEPTLVRGLDYYNKTVFEFVSPLLGAQSTFCGGGRYDQLVTQIGGKQDQSSIGAAIGLERLQSILEQTPGALPLIPEQPIQVIIPVSAAQRVNALLLADELRAEGLLVDVLLDGESLKSGLRKANKLGAAHCLIIGEEEQNAHQVTIKNMVLGVETRIPQTEAATHLKK